MATPRLTSLSLISLARYVVSPKTHPDVKVMLQEIMSKHLDALNGSDWVLISKSDRDTIILATKP